MDRTRRGSATTSGIGQRIGMGLSLRRTPTPIKFKGEMQAPEMLEESTSFTDRSLSSPVYTTDNSQKAKQMKLQLDHITRKLHDTLDSYESTATTIETQDDQSPLLVTKQQLASIDDQEVRGNIVRFMERYDGMTDQVINAIRERDEMLYQLAEWFTVDHLDLDDIRSAGDAEEDRIKESYFETMTSLEKLKKIHLQIEELSKSGKCVASLNKHKEDVEKTVVENLNVMKEMELMVMKERVQEKTSTVWRDAAGEIATMMQDLRGENDEVLAGVQVELNGMVEKLETQESTVKRLTNELRDKKEIVKKLTTENTELVEQLTTVEHKFEQSEAKLQSAQKQIKQLNSKKLTKRDKKAKSKLDLDDSSTLDTLKPESDPFARPSSTHILDQDFQKLADAKQIEMITVKHNADMVVLKKQLKQTFDELTDVKKEHDQTKTTLQEKEQQVHGQVKLADELQDEKNKLKAELDHNKRTISKLQQELDNYQKANRKLQNTLQYQVKEKESEVINPPKETLQEMVQPDVISTIDLNQTKVDARETEDDEDQTNKDPKETDMDTIQSTAESKQTDVEPSQTKLEHFDMIIEANKTKVESNKTNEQKTEIVSDNTTSKSKLTNVKKIKGNMGETEAVNVESRGVPLRHIATADKSVETIAQPTCDPICNYCQCQKSKPEKVVPDEEKMSLLQEQPLKTKVDRDRLTEYEEKMSLHEEQLLKANDERDELIEIIKDLEKQVVVSEKEVLQLQERIEELETDAKERRFELDQRASSNLSRVTSKGKHMERPRKYSIKAVKEMTSRSSQTFGEWANTTSVVDLKNVKSRYLSQSHDDLSEHKDESDELDEMSHQAWISAMEAELGHKMTPRELREVSMYKAGDCQGKMNMLLSNIMDYVTEVGRMIYTEGKDEGDRMFTSQMNEQKKGKRMAVKEKREQALRQRKRQVINTGTLACSKLKETFELLISALGVQNSEMESVYNAFKISKDRQSIQKAIFAGTTPVFALEHFDRDTKQKLKRRRPVNRILESYLTVSYSPREPVYKLRKLIGNADPARRPTKKKDQQMREWHPILNMDHTPSTSPASDVCLEF